MACTSGRRQVRLGDLIHSLLLIVLDSAGADFLFIPERPPKSNPWEDEMCDSIQRVRFSKSFSDHLIDEIIYSIGKLENVKPL